MGIWFPFYTVFVDSYLWLFDLSPIGRKVKSFGGCTQLFDSLDSFLMSYIFYFNLLSPYICFILFKTLDPFILVSCSPKNSTCILLGLEVSSKEEIHKIKVMSNSLFLKILSPMGKINKSRADCIEYAHLTKYLKSFQCLLFFQLVE